MACLYLMSLGPGAIGQGATDTGTMSVSVLPPDGSLNITNQTQANAPIEGVQVWAMAPAPQQPATVSAAIRLPVGLDVVPGSDTVPTFITVQDERGTGAGWDVVLTATDEANGWDPVLQENAPSTVTRVLPEAAPPAGHDAVSVGGTTSTLRQSVGVLRAEEGSGAGVYVQTLAITWPDPEGAPGLVSVQLPAAP